jgi:hypothetical protein
MKTLLGSVMLLLFLQSCTAAAFSKAQPSKSKPLPAFPKALHGSWQSTEESNAFYVDAMAFDDSTVTYEMNAISPGNPATLALSDSVAIRAIKNGYVFAIAGDNLWLNYVIRMPSKNELRVYGFDEDAKNYVKDYEEEDSEQGIVFIKYNATDKEWAKLLKSPALKLLRTFKRI